jgi:hypothetical protein
MTRSGTVCCQIRLVGEDRLFYSGATVSQTSMAGSIPGIGQTMSA